MSAGRPPICAILAYRLAIRTSEQSPNGVNGIEHVVGRDRAIDAVLDQAMHRRHPARHVAVIVAADQEQIGRRQRGHRDAGRRRAASPASSRSAAFSAENLVTCPTATRPPQPVSSASRQTSSTSRWRGVEPEIEMEVDIDVEALRQREDARDLAVRILVHIGRAADHIRTGLAAPRPARPRSRDRRAGPPAETRKAAGRSPRHSPSSAAAARSGWSVRCADRPRHACACASCPA